MVVGEAVVIKVVIPIAGVSGGGGSSSGGSGSSSNI